MSGQTQAGRGFQGFCQFLGSLRNIYFNKLAHKKANAPEQGNRGTNKFAKVDTCKSSHMKTTAVLFGVLIFCATVSAAARVLGREKTK